MADPKYVIYSSGIKKPSENREWWSDQKYGTELAVAIKGGAVNFPDLFDLKKKNHVVLDAFNPYYKQITGKDFRAHGSTDIGLRDVWFAQNISQLRDIADSIGITQVPIFEYTNGQWQQVTETRTVGGDVGARGATRAPSTTVLTLGNVPPDQITIDNASRNKLDPAQVIYYDSALDKFSKAEQKKIIAEQKELKQDPAMTAQEQYKLDPTPTDPGAISRADQEAIATARIQQEKATGKVQAARKAIPQKESVRKDIERFLQEVYPLTKGVIFDQKSKGIDLSAQAGGVTAYGGTRTTEGFNYTFDFDWNPETLQITRLDLFRDGDEWQSITESTQIAKFNNDLQIFSLGQARGEGEVDTLAVPSATTAAAAAATAATAAAGTGGRTVLGGLGAFPLGQNLAATGLDMPGSLQQQALSRVPLSTYRQTLPAAMPGGGIPLMRGLYKTPLDLAQEAYLLSARMGTFQPDGSIPSGTGAFDFQRYLGGQPDYIGDLQAGLGAIEQVKNKIISGVSPDLLSDAEKQIYEYYIGGSENDPYSGSRNELALRQKLTQMLPAPIRGAASRNLQNIYNQALATRPSTVGGMPQSLMYGGATGTGSPFGRMAPMNVTVPTGTSPYQRSPQQPATVNITGGVNMNNALLNNALTEDGQSIIFKRDSITGSTVGALEGVSTKISEKEQLGGGTRVELMTHEEADNHYRDLLDKGQLSVTEKQRVLSSGRYPKTAQLNEELMQYGMSYEEWKNPQRREKGALAQAQAKAKADAAIIAQNQKEEADARIRYEAIHGVGSYQKLLRPGGSAPTLPNIKGKVMPGAITTSDLGPKIKIKGGFASFPYDPTQLIPNPWDVQYPNMERF